MRSKTNNTIEHYRKRMRFKRSDISRLLGHADSSAVVLYERGTHIPSLRSAFKLGIILRVPLEFLYPELYETLRDKIRAEEERQVSPVQQQLF